ncbi:MAG TPA: hypothetical protein VNZ52_15145 [Candidatus Thermoplasmatota archaeon]|nr:hypothetical protein [Candidatus Thermoplasmatota archaeon]
MRWPWTRRKDPRPEATVEGTLRFRFQHPADPEALRKATRAGLKAAARSIAGKGAVRVTADLEEGRLAHIALSVRGPEADAALHATAARAFVKTFRVRYRGVFATRELPEALPPPEG